MFCFEVKEKVRQGLLVVRRNNLHSYTGLHTPRGCPVLEVEPDTLSFVETLPAGEVRLERANVTFEKDRILFRRPTGRPERYALVQIETVAGDEGKVYLTSSSYEYELRSGKERVNQRFHPLPHAGLQTFCSKEELEKLRVGVDRLDVLLLMHPGASFRIYRTGHLEGAWPRMAVVWTGSQLVAKLPNGYGERDGVVGTLPAAAE